MRSRASKSWILVVVSPLFLAALSFCLGFMPSMPKATWTGSLFTALDTPISALNVVLPAQLRSGLARRFLNGTYCFPGPFWYESLRYMAVGFVSYLLLLGVIVVVVNRITLWVGARSQTPI